MVSILVSLVLTVPIVGILGRQARDVVIQFNLRQISKVLDMNFIEGGVYPSSINQLVVNKEIQNIPLNNSYLLHVSDDGKKASVLGASTNKMYCWKSETEQILIVGDLSSCYP